MFIFINPEIKHKIMYFFRGISNKRALLDLGASINVMPYHVYASLNLSQLEETGIIIQLADRSNSYPKGVI